MLLVQEDKGMGKRNKWSKWRWRTGMPDDPKLWHFEGGKARSTISREAEQLQVLLSTIGEPPNPEQRIRWT
jgi:hypothetical protein